MNLIQAAMYLVVGYLVGIWLAAPGLFSWTMSATAWSNVTVYAYILFWPFILLFHFIILALLLAAIGTVIYLVADKLWG